MRCDVEEDMKTMEIFQFIRQLDENGIYYELSCRREGYIMFEITVPGERWEVEFHEAGEVEIEIFKSDGKMYDERMIQTLFSKWGEKKQ